MKLASQFNVPAAPDKVFTLFFDAETMRACIPGCEELVQVDQQNYKGSLTNEVAHVKFKAGFAAEIQSVTEPSDPTQPSVVHAILKGEDRRLGSTIKIDATMTVVPQGAESLVSYELEMAMWGKLGRLGEPVIRRRSIEVEKQFAAALTAVCAGQPIASTQAKPKKAGRPVTSETPTSTAPQSTPLGVAPAAGDTTRPLAAERTRDVPFIVAVAAAAFAFGVIFGSRGRKR